MQLSSLSITPSLSASTLKQLSVLITQPLQFKVPLPKLKSVQSSPPKSFASHSSLLFLMPSPQYGSPLNTQLQVKPHSKPCPQSSAESHSAPHCAISHVLVIAPF